MLDTFASAGTNVYFYVASQRLPGGVTDVGWLTSYEASGAAHDPSNAQCWPAPANMARVSVDGQPAWVSTGCGWNDAFIFAGGRVYNISETSDPFYNYPLFKAFLSTVSFDPARADDTPVARQSSSPRPS
jgi:hypothetical protein